MVYKLWKFNSFDTFQEKNGNENHEKLQYIHDSKIADLSKPGSRNMAETCAIGFFVLDLLFDFYGVRGSTATHSARFNVKLCGLTNFGTQTARRSLGFFYCYACFLTSQC